MNTRQLQYVITLAEEKSFSETAKRLLISQPSLSQYIQKLEKELGTELFERTLPLKLTNAGEAYVRTAKKIVSMEEEMIKQLEDIQNGVRGRLVIGTGFLNSVILLPNIISLFQRRFPKVEIFIYEDMEPNLKLKADAGELDLIFSTSEIKDSAYQGIQLFQEEYLLATPIDMSFGRSGHPYGEFNTIDISRAKDLPFIMLSSNTYISETVESIYHARGIEPRRIVTCTSATAAYHMTKAGVGATLIPFSTYKTDYSPNVNYYRIADCNWRRTVRIYYNNNRYMSKVMKEFITESERYFEENYMGNERKERI